MTTTKEMIEVMQAFEDGKPIEVIRRCRDDAKWALIDTPRWQWGDNNYRIAVIKPSWDWSHVSDDINFLMRQSPALGGNGVGLSVRPEKTNDYWIIPHGFVTYVKFFASYDPGTCDWQDSLVVRPGYVEADQ